MHYVQYRISLVMILEAIVDKNIEWPYFFFRAYNDTLARFPYFWGVLLFKVLLRQVLKRVTMHLHRNNHVVLSMRQLPPAGSTG